MRNREKETADVFAIMVQCVTVADFVLICEIYLLMSYLSTCEVMCKSFLLKL